MKIIHFADLHLGVETYGRIDPATGLSTRLGDFLAALDKLVDYAIEKAADLVVFCGDAYKSREPSQTQQREFAVRINRLSTAGIPMFILIGNHDLPNAVGKATATEIFHTLKVENVYVSNRPEIYKIGTKSGVIQVASLPWLRRSAIIGREDVKNLTLEEINNRMRQVLNRIVSSHAEKLDPALPSVLAAHVGVANATIGSERLMAIGQEHFLLPGDIANPAFDYIALGHIHKHQVLSENPLMVYSGSLERVDFGEEADDKGFCVVDIQPDAGGGRKVSFEFEKVRGRSFRTISVNLEPGDADPTETVLKAIRPDDRDGVNDAIVRLQISMPAEMEGQLRDSEIRESLKNAYYSTVAKDVSREARESRMGVSAAEEIAPCEALKTYLEANYPPERAAVLLEYGKKLIDGEEV